MELMQWFLMGVLFTLSVFALAWLSVKVKLQWFVWAGLMVGVLAVLFGFGWAGASYLEGVAQSGSLALVFFSGTGVIMNVLLWRFFVGPELDKQQVNLL